MSRKPNKGRGKGRGKPRRKVQVTPLGDRVETFIKKTGISRPTTYRMMAAGQLKYAQVTERIRLILTSEYERLGLIAPTNVAGEQH
jgi:hypothetical protein